MNYESHIPWSAIPNQYCSDKQKLETRFLKQYLRQFLKSLTGYKPEATRTKPTNASLESLQPTEVGFVCIAPLF